MKKRPLVILSLAVIALGIAMTVVNFKFDPFPRFRTLIGCAYAVLGFGIYGASAVQVRKNWRGIVGMALLGVILAGIGWFFSTWFVIFYFCAVLYRALLGTPKKRADVPGIELPPGSGFLLVTVDHVFYQLLRGRERLCLVFLGMRFDAPDAKLVIDSEDAFGPGELNRAIPFEKIRGIRVLEDGSLRILGRNGGRFFAAAPATVEDVAAYLEGLPVAVKRPPAPRLPKTGTETLRNVLFTVTLVSGLCAAAWMYLDAPARLLGTLNAALFVVSFALFCLFYDFIVFEAKKKTGGIGLSGLLFPFFPLFLHFFRDYDFASAKQFVVPTAILACCLFLLFLIANARRRPWKAAFGLLLLFVPLSIFMIGNLNVLWDDGSRAHTQTARVWYIPRSTKSGGDESRLIYVDIPINEELKIPTEVSEALTFGSKLLIVERTGLLGIDYTTVEIPE